MSCVPVWIRVVFVNNLTPLLECPIPHETVLPRQLPEDWPSRYCRSYQMLEMVTGERFDRLSSVQRKSSVVISATVRAYLILNLGFIFYFKVSLKETLHLWVLFPILCEQNNGRASRMHLLGFAASCCSLFLNCLVCGWTKKSLFWVQKSFLNVD